uniref:Uncharacterized protein n=1 Tax=Tetradesmus obliquus TaxID=3088 RepID=A0A383W3A8_TETOB|eukprot:jgi/Sobl393_1/13996/SZX71690.1
MLAGRYKFLSPLVLIAVATLFSFSLIAFKHGVVFHTSEAATGHLAEQQEHQLAAEIKQLSNNQTQILDLLQRLISSQNNQSSGSASQQHGSPDDATARLDRPDSSGPGEAAIPAAVAALPQLTSLHNAVLRSSKDFEQHRAVARQLLDQLVHMNAAAAQQEVERQLQQQELTPLQRFVYQLYGLLLSSGRLFPCREDTSLVPGEVLPSWPASSSSGSSGSSSSGGGSSGGGRSDAAGSATGSAAGGALLAGSQQGSSSAHGSSSSSSSSSSTGSATPGSSSSSPGSNPRASPSPIPSSPSSSSSSSSPRYFFAANLRDNSVQVPHFTLSLLQTLLRLPRDAAFVSVYESNSDDGVHGWIDVMQLALNVIGTPSRLVARGMLVRREGQHRIEFLAQVRNMALAPLYSHYSAAAAAAAAAAANSSSSPAAGSSSSSSSSSSRRRPAAPGGLPWDPDYVVFLNDVFFCWGMVLRLMGYRADITCGLDFWQNRDATVALPLGQRTKGHLPKPTIPAQYQLEAPLLLANASSPDQANPIVFYDIWVARDVGGSKFWWAHPFVNDGASAAAVQQGLPFRASCCWNGLTILAAEPFRRGVRFRSHIQPSSSSSSSSSSSKPECRASECSLLCDDFARLGFERVVVDAGVQVAYDWGLAREMMAGEAPQ